MLFEYYLSGFTWEEWKFNLEQVLRRLNDYNVKLNPQKCKLFLSEIDLLGYRLNGEGLLPSPEKVKTIKLTPRPKNVTELKSFLGLVNFYNKFVKMSADVLYPLYKLLRKDVWSWSDECEYDFISINEILAEKSLLVLYKPSLPLVVTADSSSYGVGAALAHIINGIEQPIAFASATLSDSEKNYSQLDREALAIIFAVKRFHKYLIGRNFY